MRRRQAEGRLYAGTSGFAYTGWAPRFYPAGTRSADLLREYAARLPAVELNNTFYQQPRAERVARWLADTPTDFRFVVKAQRGGSLRALGETGGTAVDWLSAPYRLFGERLGAVLFRVAHNVARDDERLARLLAAWPADLPLAVEFQHDSWRDDSVHELLRRNRAALCATDLDEQPPPDLLRTGGLIYLRLRRSTYTADELAGWYARLEPFLGDGCDCYVFLRHDERGRSALLARRLQQMGQ